MSHPDSRDVPPTLDHHDYESALHHLQIELVGLQREVIRQGRKLLLIFEGRDAAGKDGSIKRIVEHLSPREVRVVALGKPSDREQTQWYFQRFAPHLPAAGEIVLFNRSWYNRAGVEPVMGYCSKAECRNFLASAPVFERMLVESGIELYKFYLDISRQEQARRLESRRKDPLKQWKISPVDAAAQKHWRDYSRARDRMLLATHQAHSPWLLLRADDKRQARLNLIRELLRRAHGSKLKADPRVLRPFQNALIEGRWLAP
ncbi:polyphosphate kinase 2, PA0141 family [Solimonas aquatica]|uniref:ADP/GDP-polyphosphate phosphotransferase n=1 Tax=Solimonas aquatica TaxID=489703 RepID=A0A1H9BML7_9GAMM|nr:polyphosphate kinase 2 [Solimonas aquatica]SEP90254.1 polyphosphate kinase 2, PA0141 family [Solimonas aquatica]